MTLRGTGPVLDLLDGATLSGTGGRPRWDVDMNGNFSYGVFNLGVYGRLQGADPHPQRHRRLRPALLGPTWLVLYSFVRMEKGRQETLAKGLNINVTVETC